MWVKSKALTVDAYRKRARNLRALVLFGRTVMTSLAVISGALGFYTGIRLQQSSFDPYAYATGVGALFAAACAVIAFMMVRRRFLLEKLRKAEARAEELTDRNWELREAAEHARSLLEAQGDLIVRRDAQGRVTYANDAFCALIGRARAELSGQPLDLPLLQQGEVTVLADGTRLHDQKIASSASARWIAWREVAVRTESGNEVQSVGRDVTDRAEAERARAVARDQAEAANRAKSRFLATVSHEIRTPLNGMLGMADLLLDTPLTAEQRTYAKAAKTSGETLLSLIEEILDFSKIEAGKLDLESRPFALAPLVEETIELLSTRAQTKGIEIASFVDERLPAMVVGDAARLRQVLLNLAGNAIKFTEKGGVAVIVEPSDEHGEVQIQVRDTGIGIKGEDQARIFRDFEQADSSRGRKFGGTGLGLAISKRIVERMDGAIALESAPGVGTTFTVTLPLAAALDENAPAPFVAPDLTGHSILIVSAAEVEASLLARRLGRWGARTCAVTDEAIAFALMPERAWNAVLVDYALMPAMVANADFRKLKDTRRIVLIAPADRQELSSLKEHGFTGYLVKPVRAISLAARFAAEDTFEPSADASAEQDKNAATAALGKALSILVVEDNEINALLARALLTRLGHRASVATNGEAAVESWQAAQTAGAPYDLVLMDVQMPGMDGLEAARRIRAVEADHNAKPVRIVALTANASAEDRTACLAAGMNGLLVKPLDRERLSEELAGVAPPATASLAA